MADHHLNIDEDGVTPLVEVSGLAHTYRDAPGPVLDRVSLVVPAGQIVGLVGHNGAGKTTMPRILTFLLRPNTGMVRIAGHALYHDPVETTAAKQLVGAVSDVPLLYERLTGREFVRFIGQTYGLSSGLEDRIATLLAHFELAEHGDLFLRSPRTAFSRHKNREPDPRSDSLPPAEDYDPYRTGGLPLSGASCRRLFRHRSPQPPSS